MIFDPDQLTRLGFDAGAAVAGPGAVERVQVLPALSSDDRPAYHFAFLVNPDHVPMGMGLFRIQLRRKIQDELEAHDDDHYLLTQLLDQKDWDKRFRG